MLLTVPNILTWLRIGLIPVFSGIYYFPDTWLSTHAKDWIGMLIFLLAAITDWFDGYLARRLGQTSAFGAFLDPVADKLMVAAALIMLVQLGRADALLAIVIIGREITISALREWMAKVGQARSVAVSFLGKVKTLAQMIAIVLLLLHEPIVPWIDTAWAGTICLWIATIITLWSMIYYLRLAVPHIAEGDP